MPDYGLLTEDRLPHTLPAVAPLYPPPPWPLPNTRFLKITFETAKEAVLAWLPPKLSRSSPAYGAITVAHYPESPLGPFSLACQHIGCRAGFFIRAYALQAVVDTPPAVAGLREIWGLPCKLGEVTLDFTAAEASASVSREGRVLAEVSTTGLEPTDPDSLRLDPVLAVRASPSVEEGKRHDIVQMIQIDPESEIRDSMRGRGTLRYPEPSEGDPWHLLPCLNVISTVRCVMNTEMPLARFVMPY